MSSLINIPLAIGTVVSLPFLYKLYRSGISTEAKFGVLIVLMSGLMTSIRNNSPLGLAMAASLIVGGYLLGFDINFNDRVRT